MLKRSARLKSSRDIREVFAKGRSMAAGLIVIHVLPKRGAQTQFAFSVSTKLGKSTVRNRIKRLLREAVRPFLERVRSGRLIVIVARSNCKHAKFSQIKSAVEKGMEQMGLLRENAVTPE